MKKEGMVMKKSLACLALALFFLLLPLVAQGAEYPVHQGYVNDFAGVIEPQLKLELTELTKDLEAKTGAELAVVTVKTLKGKDIKTYSNELFQQWKIGKSKEDNGVLLLMALQEKKVRIEVGYGLEGILPDGKCGRILDQRVLPFFRQADYGQGLYQGAQAIASEIYQEAGIVRQMGSSKLPAVILAGWGG